MQKPDTRPEEPAASPFIDALMMHNGDPEHDSTMSVKNEHLPTLKACNLNFFRSLLHLDLSMNRISILDGGFESTNLRTLILQDNLIKEIPVKLVQKLPSLTRLNLDMNQISKIENLEKCTSLLDLSLH